jgi:hypothetical protein
MFLIARGNRCDQEHPAGINRTVTGETSPFHSLTSFTKTPKPKRCEYPRPEQSEWRAEQKPYSTFLETEQSEYNDRSPKTR